MAEAIERELDSLRDIGTPEELAALAACNYEPQVRPKANAHVHLPPNFSAFSSVVEALDLAAEQGVRILGVSNYYDFSIYAHWTSEARSRGIYPLFGLEVIALVDEVMRRGVLINDPGNPGKMYLCGKGITRFGVMTSEARRLLRQIRQNDESRMREMVNRMEGIFAEGHVPTGLDEDAIIARIVCRHGADRETVTLQERHIAQAFQERLFELVPAAERTERLARILGAPAKARPQDHVKIQNEIRSHLMKAGRPAFVEESFINLDEACRLILELGGIPCYPTLADGTSPICAYEDPPEKLIEALEANRIFFAEFIPIRNRPDVLKRYVRPMRDAGFVITAGTEHNTLDLIPMEPACALGMPIPEKIGDIFLEGAYVVSAHQFLSLHGQCGYVDNDGNLHSGFSNREERIAYFRDLGRVVIARYFEKSIR